MTINWDFKDEFCVLFYIRKSGTVNMFGASRPLAEALDIPMDRAMSALINWMENYDEIHAFLKKEGLVE